MASRSVEKRIEPPLQAGGHRYDPGTLHRSTRPFLVCEDGFVVNAGGLARVHHLVLLAFNLLPALPLTSNRWLGLDPSDGSER